MIVTKKYRGTLPVCVEHYLDDKLAGRTDIDLHRAFLTHSGMTDESMIKMARKHILKLQKFDELLIARAGSTISTHCGPNTMSVVFSGMFLGGLWHGASWNFVFWGMLHGVALAAHKFWMGITGRKKAARCGSFLRSVRDWRRICLSPRHCMLR